MGFPPSLPWSLAESRVAARAGGGGRFASLPSEAGASCSSPKWRAQLKGARPPASPCPAQSQEQHRGRSAAAAAGKERASAAERLRLSGGGLREGEGEAAGRG